MTLSHPDALWWMLLAVPIALLYLLRIRTQRRTVAATMILRQVVGDRQTTPLARRLVSLGVQLALLVLIVAALAEPAWWDGSGHRHVVVVIDNSASMNAPAGNAGGDSETRLDAAVLRAETLVDSLRRGDRMTILSAAGVVRRHAGATGHKRTLHQALKSIPATSEVTNMTRAVDVARQLLGNEEGEIVLLTDAAFDGAAELAAADDVRLMPVTSSAENVAVTRLAVRPRRDEASVHDVLVEVANFSDQPAECNLTLTHAGVEVHSARLKLDASQRRGATVRLPLPGGGLLVARIEFADAVPGDHVATVAIPRTGPRRVLLVTQGNPPLERALRAISRVELSTVETLPGEVPGKSIVVLDRPLAGNLPAGPLLVIRPGASTDLWQLGPPLRNPVVTFEEEASPLMAHVRLREVHFPLARAIITDAGIEMHPLARTSSGECLYAALESGGRRVLVLSVDPAVGDLRLDEAFPQLIASAIRWLGGEEQIDSEDDALRQNLTAESDLRPRVAVTGDDEVAPSSGGIRPVTCAMLLAWLLAGVEWVLYHTRRIL